VLALSALAATAGTAGLASAHGDEKHVMAVNLQFAAVAGTTPVACGTPIPGLGTGSTTAALQDLRFYISNVRLVRENGSSVPLTLTGKKGFNLAKGGNHTTLIDLENGTGSCTEGDRVTNTVIRGTVPEGHYHGVRMYLGVPFVLNHSDITSAPAPLDLAGMNWSWQSGRKFAKIEVIDPAGAAGTWAWKAFFVHLGSTGCTGDPATGATVGCRKSNRMAVRLAEFDPKTEKIAVDVKALLAGNDITLNKAGAPGCMSGDTDPECLGVFDALKIDWRPDGTGNGAPIDHGAGQTVFKAIAR
jgi:uncharacterized repeat protein (TIGR04052 family)